MSIVTIQTDTSLSMAILQNTVCGKTKYYRKLPQERCNAGCVFLQLSRLLGFSNFTAGIS